MITLRRLTFYIGIVISILIMISFVVAQDDSVRKEVEALYAKWDQAIKSSDAGLAKSLLTENYALKDLDGKVTNRAKVLEDVAKPTKDKEWELISFNTKVENLKQGKDENEA